MLIDTHAHINFPEFKETTTGNILANAKQNDVQYMINIGSDLKTSQESAALAENHSEIYAAVGIHPHDAQAAAVDPSQLNGINNLLKKDKVVALGETGLDYFKNYCPINIQKDIFEQQLEIAINNNKPIIIHNREADNDIYEILKSTGYQKIVIHCFSSDVAYARKILDLGFYISFTGNITFPKNATGQEVAKYVSLDRIMVETDCPFMSPVPHRGKTNEPAFVKHVAEKIAELKNISLAEVAEQTTKNAVKFFGLPI
jgi:TatD DNase family protein